MCQQMCTLRSRRSKGKERGKTSAQSAGGSRYLLPPALILTFLPPSLPATQANRCESGGLQSLRPCLHYAGNEGFTLKTHQMFSVHTTLEEFGNEGFTLKTHQMFSEKKRLSVFAKLCFGLTD